jgi:hypothetical protein
LLRAFARVGIVALVDEATGFQDIRARDDLHKILEAYIAKELLPWTKRFPNEFYKEIAVATSLIKVCDDKDEFARKFERAFPC